MGQEKTARQDVVPRRANADEHDKGMPAIGGSPQNLELSLGAAASGVKAPWVTANLRGAGLTPTQIASIHSPHHAHPGHSPHHASSTHHAHSTHPAHPAARLAHAELAHAESHVPETHAAPSYGPIAPSGVAPASAPELAPLHEAGAAVAQHADAGMTHALHVLASTSKQLTARIHGAFAAFSCELDTHHGLESQRVRAAAAAQRTKLRSAIDTARLAIAEGDSLVRAQLARLEGDSTQKSERRIAALPAAYETRASLARHVADGVLTQYVLFAQKQRAADPTPPTFTAGDMAQTRFEARKDAGLAVHGKYVGNVDLGAQKKIAAANDTSGPLRIQVRTAVSQTVQSLRDGELADVRQLVARAIDSQLARLSAQLDAVEASALHALDAGLARGKAQLKTAEGAAVSALGDAVRSHGASLHAGVSERVRTSQDGVAKGAARTRSTLATIDRLLVQPGVSRGPAAQKLRTLRAQLVARIAASARGLAGHASEHGAETAHAAAHAATSLRALCDHACAQADRQLGAQVRALGATGAHAVAELAAFVAGVASESTGIAAQVKGAFLGLVTDASKALAALDGRMQAALAEEVRSFGVATVGFIREAPSMYSTMIVEGEKAARAAQPRWKFVVKFAIAAVVTLAVGVAAFTLAPMTVGFVGAIIGKGLLATILGGALFGAASGAATAAVVQIAQNAIDLIGDVAPMDAHGAPLTLGSGVLGWKGALVTGLWTGALGGALSSGIAAKLGQHALSAFVAGEVANIGVDVLAQLATRGQYSLEAGLENAVISAAVGGAVGFAATRARAASGAETPGLTERVGDYVRAAHDRGEVKGAAMGESVLTALTGKEAAVPSGLAHAGVDPALHLAQMQEHGLTPGKSFKVGKAKIRLGALVDMGDGRIGVHMYVTVKGKTSLRVAYKSKSQGSFRLLPAVNEAPVRNLCGEGYDKGGDEHALTLPSEVQERLGRQLEQHGVREGIAPEVGSQIIEDGARRNSKVPELIEYQEGPDHASKHVRKEGILEPVAEKHAHDPSHARVAAEAHRPDFQRLVRRFAWKSALAGDVEAQVFHSHDGSLEYVVMKDAEDHIWIQSVSKLRAKVTPLGVREVSIDAKALTTPLWEYRGQIPGDAAGGAHPRSPEYASAWRYLRELPEIKAWYAATGTTMPDAAH